MDRSRREESGTWATFAKLLLTIGPFALLAALFALHRWIS